MVFKYMSLFTAELLQNIYRLVRWVYKKKIMMGGSCDGSQLKLFFLDHR